MPRALAFCLGLVLLTTYLALRQSAGFEGGSYRAADAAPATAGGAEDVIDELRKLGRLAVDEWRYDVDGAQDASAKDFDDHSWRSKRVGHEWRGNNTWVWFRTVIVVPPKLGNFAITPGPLRLVLTVDDAAEVFVDGRKVGERFDWDGDVVLTDSAKPGDRLVVALHAFNNGGPGRLMAASLVFDGLGKLNTAASDYQANLALARAVVKFLGKDEPEWKSIVDASLGRIDRQAIARGEAEPVIGSLSAAAQEFHRLKPLADHYSVNLAGYSHIDLAWLWRWIESVQVCKETFSQAIRFFNEFPDFHFSMTQAHAYRWMEQREPALFAAMQKAVKDGRWEIVGGTMVELDCNLPDAESHARQILYGKRYFREKFGVDPKIGWCPDSFGYNGNLPQLLKKGGLDYFVTSKITWNDTNPFPHHLFWWEAPDGSRVLAFLPYEGYTFDVDGEKIIQHLADFEREVGRKEVMFIYGVGNHGGGPTREEIRRAERLKTLDWFPQVRTDTAHSFFDRIPDEERAKLPTWKSELYLEFHRGTYTSQAANKKANRQGEVRLMATEKLAALAALNGDLPYPKAAFREAWDLLLFNQMHDILPGSSITPVYRDSAEDYRQMFATLDGIERQSLAAITGAEKGAGAAAGGLQVFNTLSFARSEGVTIPMMPADAAFDWRAVDEKGEEVAVQWIAPDGDAGQPPALTMVARDVPAMGFRTFRLEQTGPRHAPAARRLGPLENAALRVEIDETSGDITSLKHLPTGHQVLAAGAAGNRLQLFEDKPKVYDAWELDLTRRKWEIERAASVQVVEDGPVRTVVRVKKTFLGEKKARRAPTNDFPSSFFTQDLILWRDLPRLDVRMRADWWEEQTAMKVAFPLSIDPPVATYEIPFAHLERSTRRETSFDQARHEVSAQKWADMSQDGFGVSILNDSKYGYDALNNVIRLTLLRSPNSPDPVADRGRHEFTYSIYPHAGDWRTGGTVQQAYSLNTPLLAVRGAATTGPAGINAGHSLVSCDAPNVLVTTVKEAEDNGDWIVRLYDWAGESREVTLTFPFDVKSAEVTGIMEDPGTAAKTAGKTVRIPVGAYAIETIRVRR